MRQGEMKVRLEQLYALVEIAQLSSMAKAAKKLHTSSQNISKWISQLEEEFDVILFTRSNKGVWLTPQGKEIYELAVEIINKTDSLKYYVDQLPKVNHSLKGTLRLYAHINQTSMMIPLLEKMHLFYPNIRLSLNTSLDMPTPEQFASGEYHVAFACGPKSELPAFDHYSKEADIYCYREDSLKVVMNQNSPYINQRTMSLKTLSKLPLIDYAGDFKKPSFVRLLFAAYDLPVNVIFSCSDPLISLEYIARNEAYCFGSNSTMQVYSHAAQLPITLKPLKEKIMMSNLMIITKNKKNCQKEIEAFKQVFSYQYQEEYKKISFIDK